MEEKDLKLIAQSIVGKLDAIRTTFPNFNPSVYVGKCTDFQDIEKRHLVDGDYQVLLRVAECDSRNAARLEDLLIGMFKNDTVVHWHLNNKNGGSGGNPTANKIYICFDSSVECDELYDWDELQFLGQEYPIQIK